MNPKKSLRIKEIILRRVKDIFGLRAYFSIVGPDVLRFLSKAHPYELFVDVGANVGDYTFLMAKMGCRVVAFEPDPRAFFILQKKARNFRNVTLYEAGLGEEDGTKKFYLTPELGRSSVVYKQPEYITIKVMKLDSLKLIPNWMKIDVEGYEYQVLLGAINTISSCKPNLIVEFHGKENFALVSNFLKHIGYNLKARLKASDMKLANILGIVIAEAKI